ncbi:exopolysaccharide biosynthesis polyprenyl glycosylphosphotransferase [Nocardioides salarius]|uniref:Exopolysaccharide biosynthesis polyprenyl glycosylphosphotransferase n=1 Tax=Nocardioides salarius TaxID=374513 RepID=A0ABS2ME40_9ACTN|nr:exopolysaccharide biosynthesis polyprenyl glycosylphosphotransferase [Nocardioides salarius]MBM7509449.1 exopolysaccharide biosynthesis polyprenyl glycosylphosphotransferase [Nocardioides salarius]
MSAYADQGPRVAHPSVERLSRPVQRRTRWYWMAATDALVATVAAIVWLPPDLVPGPALAVAFAVAWVVLLGLARTYDPGPVPRRADLLRICLSSIHLVALGALLSGITGLLVPADQLVRAAGTACVASAGLRLASSLRRPPRTRVVLVGHRRQVRRLVEELHESNEVEVVALCLAGPKGCAGLDLPAASGFASVSDLARKHRADCVVALPCRHLDAASLRRLGWLLERDRVDLLIGPGLLDVDSGRAALRRTGGLSLLHVRHADLTGPRRALKTLWERAACVVALVVLAPLLLALLALVRLDSPGPALFRQQRVGRDGRIFSILKLRTMHVDAEARLADLQEHNESDGAMFKMRHDPRITRAGRWLRRLSLDELPQLVNVVRGDMALVGPRPPLPGEVTTYDEDALRRLAVRPGITGLWQVSGRSDLPWSMTVRLDSRYVDNWSLRLDAWILARTVRAVLSHDGAY